MAVVTFDPVEFKATYPEFAAVADLRLETAFMQAPLYLNNDDNSPVQNVATRKILLYMLTAHIAFLGGVLNVNSQPNPVGRVSQATEGSVSASLEYPTNAVPSMAWFSQTQYGAAFWQATTRYRSFRYSPRATVY